MKSMVCTLEEIVDPRKVIVKGYAWGLSDEEFDNLLRTFHSEINKMIEEFCVYRWTYGDHELKNLDKSLRTMKVKKWKLDSYEMTGYVKCQYISNTEDMIRAYESSAGDLSRLKIYNDNYSAVVRELLLKYKEDPIQLKKGIIKLFDMEGKKWNIQWNAPMFLPDVQAVFSPVYLGFSRLKSAAKFIFSLENYCIQDSPEWMDRIILFAKKLVRDHKRINVTIGLAQFADSYCSYFGDHPDTNFGPDGRKTGDYYNMCKCFYFPSVEWGHMVCNDTAKLGFTISDEINNIVEIEEMPGGYYFVHPEKSIFDSDVSELKAVKKCLYKMIMPRTGFVRGDRYLEEMRYGWSIIPVFPDEISMIDTRSMFPYPLKHYIGTRFQHHGTIMEYEELRDCFAR